MMLSSLTWLVTGWGGGRVGERRGGKERKGGRTLCLVLVSLGAEVVALLLEILELFADLVEGGGEGGEGGGGLGACAGGL